uniref:Prion/Doppel protein beta-ribbon domain-containing protein n=1 Tax=Varanus komodoensis TaxID=61221 RepID=A0A8D2LHJ5_VARKO
ECGGSIMNPAYPPRNPVNPPQNPAYPQNPGYQPQNPAFPAQHPGYPVRNPSNPHDPSWAQPWKPKNPKLKTKHVAGAAVAGAVVGAAGGFLMGRALSNMRFHFNNPDEERWWYEHRNRYSDRVYYPQYAQPVPEDTFVQDCWNVTVREFIEPSGNQMADEMESRVVRRVVREMCIEQYRSFSSRAGGGSLGFPNLILLLLLLAFTNMRGGERGSTSDASFLLQHHVQFLFQSLQ